MSIRIKLFGFASALVVLALSLTVAKPASALTLSFNALAYTRYARGVDFPYFAAGGLLPGSGAFVAEHEALQVYYATSGLPYYVSKVEWNTNTSVGGAKFVASEGGPTSAYAIPPLGQPVTIAGIGGVSVSPVAAPSISGTNLLTQNYAFGEFKQGILQSEFTYVKITNAGGTELSGSAFPGPGPFLDPFGNTTVTVTWSLNPGASGFPPVVVLSANFGIQTGTGLSTDHNIALTGADIPVNSVVPEPGMLAMFMGLGVTGTLFFKRRRA